MKRINSYFVGIVLFTFSNIIVCPKCEHFRISAYIYADSNKLSISCLHEIVAIFEQMLVKFNVVNIKIDKSRSAIQLFCIANTRIYQIKRIPTIFNMNLSSYVAILVFNLKSFDHLDLRVIDLEIRFSAANATRTVII